MTSELTSAREAERQADRLRGELSETLDQLSGNLAPSRLAFEAAAAVGDKTPNWLKSFARLASGPIGLGLVGATAASVAVAVLTKRFR